MRAWPSLLLAFILVGCRPADRAPRDGARRTIQDISGKSVQVPAQVRRVACLDVLCYSTMVMLDEADKVVSMQVNASRAPWVDRVRPPKGIEVLQTTPTVESLVSQDVDMVFGGYGGERETEGLARAGLVQVRAQPFGKKAATADEFLASQQAMVRVFGNAMGEKAAMRAEEWCRWYDSIARLVRSRTDTIPEARRPRVYFVRGPSPLSTHGPGGYVYWYGEMAGANMVVKNMGFGSKGGYGDVVMEDLIRLNPQIVVVGRFYPASLVLDDPKWRDVEAVKKHQVLEIPAGVFFWDGGSECGLLLLYLAKHLHPELFPDVDLRAEVQRYYRRFYGATLSDREADLLLSGRDPQGRRGNPWGI